MAQWRWICASLALSMLAQAASAAFTCPAVQFDLSLLQSNCATPASACGTCAAELAAQFGPAAREANALDTASPEDLQSCLFSVILTLLPQLPLLPTVLACALPARAELFATMQAGDTSALAGPTPANMAFSIDTASEEEDGMTAAPPPPTAVAVAPSASPSPSPAPVPLVLQPPALKASSSASTPSSPPSKNGAAAGAVSVFGSAVAGAALLLSLV